MCVSPLPKKALLDVKPNLAIDAYRVVFLSFPLSSSLTLFTSESIPYVKYNIFQKRGPTCDCNRHVLSTTVLALKFSVGNMLA